MPRYDDYDYGYYPRSKPIPAKGGIKAQSTRGGFGTQWWAKRWIAALEKFTDSGRLSRGRSYARKGQVLNVDIVAGKVTAKVQGSMPTPYRVSIAVKPLADEAWGKVIDVLSSQALYAAKLLAGEIPQEIEQVFAEARVPLFPEKSADFVTDCSCPDWSNPCKHVAAVYYLVGEEFDRDPFLIFTLRGLDRPALLARLSAAGASVAEEAAPAESAAPPEPLSVDAAAFWSGGPLPDDLLGQVSPPSVDAALLRRLGAFPFWRGATPLLDALAPTYARAGAVGLDVAAGERKVQDQQAA